VRSAADAKATSPTPTPEPRCWSTKSMLSNILAKVNNIMRKSAAPSDDRVLEIIATAITKTQARDELSDEDFGNSIDASASAVTSWRNRKAHMGSHFLTRAMDRHATFLTEYLWALGYKPTSLTEAELDDREFTVALATLQLKHAQALRDGRVDHNELIEMAPELDEVGDGVECRRATIRKLRSVA
jgi:hypothetical protein